MNNPPPDVQEPPVLRVVVAEIEDGGRYLITQRRPEASMPLLWEFPGGRVRHDESDAAALVRTLNERLGVRAVVGECVLEISHAYEGYTLKLATYRVSISTVPQNRKTHAHHWVLPDEFADYEFPGADQATVDALLFEGRRQ